MIKVLEEKPVPRETITCGNCGSVLEYGNADLHIDGFYKPMWFKCPVCGVKVVANWIMKEEQTTEQVKESAISQHEDATSKENNNSLTNEEQKPQRIVSAEAKEALYDKVDWNDDNERIRLDLINFFKNKSFLFHKREEIIAWLEKQNKQILANSAKTCKDEQKLSNLESIGEDWNDEDERILEQIKFAVLNLPSYRDDTRQECIGWLKSLKERIQSKQEWSKEDEKTLDKLITNYESGYLPPVAERCEYIIWLKSLKSHPRLELSAEDLEWFEKQGKRKSTWSKEDERILEQIKFAVLNLPSYREDTRQECIDWLKLLKERIGG